MIQFSLISLIPNLIRNLQDCADPDLDDYQRNLKPPTSLRTSDRNSLLQYMGLPLQIFGKVCYSPAEPPFNLSPLSHWQKYIYLRLTHTQFPGEPLRPVHAPPTTRRPRRLRHKVLRRRQHQLPPPPAARPLQRHPHQPRRQHRLHYLTLPPCRRRPHRLRPPLDRLPHPGGQRDVGRRRPGPALDPALRRQRGVHPPAVRGVHPLADCRRQVQPVHRTPPG